MKRFLTLAVALAITALPGCLVRGHHGGVIAVVPALHVHSDDCGHYHHNDAWYHEEGHRHHGSCGHHFSGGNWRARN